MADDHERDDERTKSRRQRQRAATRHERAARTDREAADAAEPRITARMLGGMKPPLTTSDIAPTNCSTVRSTRRGGPT
jgi:hypothetical protein